MLCIIKQCITLLAWTETLTITVSGTCWYKLPQHVCEVSMHLVVFVNLTQENGNLPHQETAANDLILKMAEYLIFTSHFLLCAIKVTFPMKVCLKTQFKNK